MRSGGVTTTRIGILQKRKALQRDFVTSGAAEMASSSSAYNDRRPNMAEPWVPLPELVGPRKVDPIT